MIQLVDFMLSIFCHAKKKNGSILFSLSSINTLWRFFLSANKSLRRWAKLKTSIFNISFYFQKPPYQPNPFKWLYTETHTFVLTCHSLLRSLPPGFCSRHTLEPCQGDDWLQIAKSNEPFQVISSLDFSTVFPSVDHVLLLPALFSQMSYTTSS